MSAPLTQESFDARSKAAADDAVAKLKATFGQIDWLKKVNPVWGSGDGNFEPRSFVLTVDAGHMPARVTNTVLTTIVGKPVAMVASSFDPPSTSVQPAGAQPVGAQPAPKGASPLPDASSQMSLPGAGTFAHDYMPYVFAGAGLAVVAVVGYAAVRNKE